MQVAPRLPRRSPPSVGRRAIAMAAAAVALAGCELVEFLPPTCPPSSLSNGRPASPDSTLDTALLDSMIDNYSRATDAPSLAVGIVHGDQLVYATAIGVADRRSAQPATIDTLYEIGSVTKTFTATLLAILVDEGRLQFDDPVASYLPGDPPISDQPDIGSTITFRQLATHTSGLARDALNFAAAYLNHDIYSDDDLLAAARQSPLLFYPGAGRSYSNLGFGLLGFAMERAADESYDAMLHSRILAPLGMNNTHIADRPEDFAGVASGYHSFDSYWPVPPAPSGVLAPAGAIISNIPDMAKYLSANLRAADATDTAPLSVAMRTALTLRIGPACGKSQALGWQTRDDEEFEGILWHGGALNGQTAFVAISPESDTGVVVLTNTWRMPEPLGYDLIRVAIDTFGGAPPPAARAIPLE